jgi:hypothetical protein
MTPKEKAVEIFEKYDKNVVSTNYKYMSSVAIKQCALIAVDELIEHAENSYYNKDIIKGAKLYWQEVKQEILKL